MYLKREKIVFNDDLLDNEEATNQDDDYNLKYVYPYGQSLDVDASTSIILTSGIIAYPANRALAACAVSKTKKGRLFVIGSEKFFEDEYFEKEENKKIAEGSIKWLLGINKIPLE